MKPRPVVPRALAHRDVEAAVDYYARNAGEAVALAFIDALEAAFAHIARHPESGSPRLAQELALPALRTWPLARYPYLVFYVAYPDRVDVWRVLDARRDIPTWLHETG